MGRRPHGARRSPKREGYPRRLEATVSAAKGLEVEEVRAGADFGHPRLRQPSPNNGSAGQDVRVSVVIPTLNEAENLPHILPRLPRDIHELVVVDGGSSDSTVEVARALYPRTKIVHQDRAGKGNALTCGFAASSGDIIVTLDGDGSTDPAEIPRFVEALKSGAHYAKGSRFFGEGGSDDITRLRSLGNWCLTRLVNGLFRTRYTDLCYGYNAFWSGVENFIGRDADGFEIETAMNIRVAKAGLNVVEVPSWEGLRLNGSSNLHTLRDGWRVLGRIARERFTMRRSAAGHLADVLHGRALERKRLPVAPAEGGADW